MKSATLSKKEGFICLQSNTLSHLFYLTSLAVTTLFFFHLISHYKSFNYTPNVQDEVLNQTNKERETCDLFQGQWIQDPTGPVYTNYSCTTIPLARNCFLQGRKDNGFLHWRWKPNNCELRRFDGERFMSIVRGKKMAFIGDSLARNQMKSLLCLLSSIETPIQIEKPKETAVDERASTTWKFHKHNFTVMALWSQFLVAATEVVLNGTATGNFHLQLDKVDPNWSKKLPSIDYAIFSDVHWFFRQNILHEGGNITDYELTLGLKKAFRTAFKAINDCKNCRKIFTLLRTYSPAHFENGAWNSGGACNRTRPIEREAINVWDLALRNAQVEEIEIARKEGEGGGNKFEVVDITEMMLMRPDGHPGVHQGRAWMKGYSDCVHWCLPGPIDTWNELLLELITRNIRS